MQFSLRNYDIKLIAAALMLVDHIGVTFFPEEWSFRIIGRLSFPLFAWLLVQGETHTKNAISYGLRLLGLAIASQFIYNLFGNNTLTFWPPPLNILFTLLLGLICLRTSRLFPKWQIPVWVLGVILADLIHVEYGSYGLTLMLLLQYIQPVLWWWVAWVSIHLIQAISWTGNGIFFEQEMVLFQGPAMLAALLLPFANHQRGPKARWFYLFYPAHLLALYGIAAMLGLERIDP